MEIRADEVMDELLRGWRYASASVQYSSATEITLQTVRSAEEEIRKRNERSQAGTRV